MNTDKLERKDWKGGQLLAFSGLDGVTDFAQALTARTAFHASGEIEAGFEKHGVLFEFFDDRGEVEPPALLRKGKCAPEISPLHQVFHDYGWTATLYADMAYQNAEIAH